MLCSGENIKGVTGLSLDSPVVGIKPAVISQVWTNGDRDGTK